MVRMPAPVSSLLWRSLRVYQVYGANTDVGKTIIATILCKAARGLWPSQRTTYLKPVSTGPDEVADDRHVRRFAPEIAAKTLFQYDLAVSPHIAARSSNKSIPPDDALLAEISSYAAQQAHHGPGWLFVETAGGVHSPSPSGSTQADLYMPLRLPVILIGDSKLGGISQTISAFESLKIRGYDVETVLLFREATYNNHSYLAHYFAQRHEIPVRTVPEPPPKPLEDDDAVSDAARLSRYYDDCSQSREVQDTLSHLSARHDARVSRLGSMSAAASEKIWYPFTQQKDLTPEKIVVIDSARGDFFHTLQSKATTTSTSTTTPTNLDDPDALLQPFFDGSASWWTQGLGHGNPHLTLAAAYAAGRYGHVMFAEAIHEPALALAETLLAGLDNPRLSRVFFSDNGSTGVEVAVKMALRAARLRYGWESGTGPGRDGDGDGDEEVLGVLGLQGSYHGDTIGAMDCSEPSVYNEKVEWYEGKGFWFEYPTVECSQGAWRIKMPDGMREFGGDGTSTPGAAYPHLSAIFDVERREAAGEGRLYGRFIRTTLERLAAQGRKFGALIIEPVVLGAGGMLLVDPLFQRTLVSTVRQSAHLFGRTTPSTTINPVPVAEHNQTWTGLPVIFDEVFTGLYRFGRFSAASFLGVHPDISVHAKLLTGGLVPLSVTAASDSIFRAFASDDKSDALLHGHSYTAHPVGCQVALASLREMQRMEARGDWDWARAAHERTDSHRDPSATNHATECLAWSVWSPEFLSWVGALPTRFVGGVWALGSVLAIRLTSVDGSTGYKGSAARAVHAALLRGRVHSYGPSDQSQSRWNVHSRVLGNTLYLMTGQRTTEETVKGVESLLREVLEKACNGP
ncbi:pyridoxal phosphate-dependent transferase [Chaetomium strumarium]|uniref:Pyridoxal phosphate-dependent transferase n=1 Tax=Chaetomium strumarium TaxID=1170767 RepID=A0AAJ0GRD9_9PEZI|nr:pyridoxal phosphate-dependent transferase [Chaetomium strumarium]